MTVLVSLKKSISKPVISKWGVIGLKNNSSFKIFSNVAPLKVTSMP